MWVWENGLLQIEMEFIINLTLFTLKLLFTFIYAFWPVLCVCAESWKLNLSKHFNDKNFSTLTRYQNSWDIS